MAYERLQAYGAEVIDAHPNPIRHLNWRILLRSTLLDKVTILAFLFGSAFLLGAIYWAVYPSNDNVARLIVAGAVLSGAILFGGAPFVLLWRWAYSLRYGRLAYAQITLIRGISAGRPLSYATLEHGAISGWWKVVLPEHTIDAGFTLDQSWAQGLWVGARVRVLLHPTKPKILLPIGPS
jgi:hypothetical protein